MFRKIVIIAASFAVFIAPLAASAGEVGNRIHDQQGRIDQGVHSGQLTYGEYRSDERHLDAINAQRDRDLRRDDGRLTSGQQARLNHELNRDSGRIYFTKHNVAHQPGA
jgi:hypothetical protein